MTYQPIFADEAIYIRWAQIMKSEPTLRFLPLTDGKTPLFMWIMMPMFKVIADPLLAGRILSIIAGFGTLIGVYLLGRLFFNNRIALFASFLIITTPYIVFFDRMALVDSLLAAFTIWSILIGFLLTKFKRIDLALLLGFLLGGGLLTKTPGMFSVLMVPLTALSMNFSEKGRVQRVLKTLGLFALAIFVSQAIYNALRLGPGFSSLSSRNSDYLRNPMNLLKNPLDPFLPFSKDLADFWTYLLGPVVILLVIGVIMAIIRKNRYAIVVFLIGLGPLLVQMCLLQTFTARYMLFSIPPFLVVSAYGLDELVKRFKKSQNIIIGILVFLLSIYPAYFIFKLETDIEKTPLPQNERGGYLEGWTAGYGLRDVAKYINDFSKTNEVIVATEGSFGTLPQGLQIYFDKNTNVTFWPGGSRVDPLWRAEAETKTVFFVANKSRVLQQPENVEVINTYPKAKSWDSKNSQDATLFYKILPDPNP